jgi:hypothetical protein
MVHILLYKFNKKGIGARACLGHDERSEEASKEASATILIIKRM